MKIIGLVLLQFFLLIADWLFGQSIETLIPQPRCSYERNEYKTYFTLKNPNKILLNPANPALFAAFRLNDELRKKILIHCKLTFGIAAIPY